MKTNLIQAYLTGLQSQEYVSTKTARDFDIHKELATRTFIRPLPSHGHLVSNNPFDLPSEFAKDVKYDFKALKDSAQGKANDHELGRLNDIGMKLGGLAIAGYLFTKKQTPLTKVMEFVGLGSFFASMNIWPKVALQLPAYLIHGVNVRQEYIDNYGRKKMFYLDNQFIPWSLYSDEQIEKIGNKMGVPKNIPNRRDVVQEKMRRIALQNNTLWMLTSGFATPIMSALICNAVTKPIAKYQEGLLNKKADKLMTDFETESGKIVYTKNDAKLAEILREHEGKPITKKLIDSIHANLSDGVDAVTSGHIRRDLEELLSPKEKFDIVPDTFDKLKLELEKNFEDLNLTFEQRDAIIPKKSELEKAFARENLPKEGITDFSRHMQVIQDVMDEHITRFIQEHPESDISRGLKFKMRSAVHSAEYGKDSRILAVLKRHSANILTESASDTIRDVAESLNRFRAKTSVLDKFAYIKAGQAPETILADSWNNVAERLLKTFEINDAKITNTRFDREFVGEMLRGKFEQIASNDESYRQVVSDIEKMLSYLEEQIESLDHADNAGNSNYRNAVISTFDDTAQELKDLHFGRTAESLIGYGPNDLTSAKNVQLAFMDNRVMGVRSSFYRILNTLDVYRRIATLENIDKILPKSMPRQAKEELVEMCKQLLIDGHMSDYAVKFSVKRNPNLNPVFESPQAKELFYSQIEVDDAGKVINRFLGKENASELAELVYDRKFYEAAMKLMYGEITHSDTDSLIKNSVVKNSFARYKKDILTFFGGDQYFARPNHLVDGVVHESSSERRFLMTGCALDEMFSKLMRQKYNSNKWLKIFGALGAGLLGVTVFAQFCFGHMKYPKGDKK